VARTVEELQAEIAELDELVELARKTVSAGTDAKWSQLCHLLQDQEETFGSGGRQRKLVVFTEHPSFSETPRERSPEPRTPILHEATRLANVIRRTVRQRLRVKPYRSAPALASPKRTMHDWNRALPGAAPILRNVRQRAL